MTTKYILGCYDSEIYLGLRRRNNELHELTNFVAALGRIMTKCAASALKGQPVLSPGRCPGLRTCWAFSPRRAARMSRNPVAKIRLIRTAAPERPGNSLIRLIRCYAV